MEAKDVGKRIIELREKRQLTQYALAHQSGVSPLIFTSWNGAKKNDD